MRQTAQELFKNCTCDRKISNGVVMQYSCGRMPDLEWLRFAKLVAEVHQTGHLVLREHDVLAAGFGELDVGCRGERERERERERRVSMRDDKNMRL